ncbi:hypothetical protein E4U55_003270 [Claviceps digitariae]|nr:hypothetical protein E4U55_003270 [Claviceps digitariae]
MKCYVVGLAYSQLASHVRDSSLGRIAIANLISNLQPAQASPPTRTSTISNPRKHHHQPDFSSTHPAIMPRIDEPDHDGLEQQLKDVIQDLYQIMVQVSTYDSTGRSSRDVLSNEVRTLSRSIQTVHATASSPQAALPSVPPELLEYVENGRNPDIYTREFTELVRRGNQLMRGKCLAFGQFRDVLAGEMAAAMPELRRDVDRVLEDTGGKAISQSNGNGIGNGIGNGNGNGIANGIANGSAAAALGTGASTPTAVMTPASSTLGE